MDQAEKLRNIIKMQNQPQNVSRVITVTSGKGGVGKSSFSVNLAIQLQRLGNRVVILDADFGLANVEVMLGIRPNHNLADLMFHNRTIKEIITKGPEGIGFISGGSGIRELTNLTKEQIFYVTQALGELDQIADIIIVDTGAGIAESVIDFATASSEILLMVTPEPTSITDAYALLKTLNRSEHLKKGSTRVKMITNCVKSYEEGKDIFSKVSIVADKFLDLRLEHLGSMLEDTYVSKSIIQQTPFIIAYPGAKATVSLLQLASALNVNRMGIQEDKKGIRQLFQNLIRMKAR